MSYIAGMRELSSTEHDVMVRYILYGMLAQWIPVPLADYIAGNIIRRQMVAKLSTAYGTGLEKPAIKILADEKFGFVSGFLYGVVLFPVKLVLGKFLILLRFKAFIDAAARSYHAARLLDYALRTGLVAPAGGGFTPRQVRRAIDTVCDKADVTSVRSALSTVLRRKTGVLKDAALFFWQALKSIAVGGRRNEEKVEAALNEAKSGTADTVRSVVSPLSNALDAIPPEYFMTLETALDAELMRQPYHPA